MHADDAPAPVVARFRVSERDYVAAMRLHARPTRTRAWLLGAMLLGLLLMLAFGSGAWRGAAIGGSAGAAVVAAASWLLLPSMARRHYRRYKTMHAPFSLALQADGLHIASEHAAGTLVWDNVLQWRRNEDYVLVYVMPRLFHIVPTAIASQGFALESLIAQLRARIGPPV